MVKGGFPLKPTMNRTMWTLLTLALILAASSGHYPGSVLFCLLLIPFRPPGPLQHLPWVVLALRSLWMLSVPLFMPLSLQDMSLMWTRSVPWLLLTVAAVAFSSIPRTPRQI